MHLIIIGEKINGSLSLVAGAIAERNEEYIVGLARKQAEAGADYLDLCAGSSPEKEVEVLLWMVELVQEACAVPLCIDSPNPKVIEKVLPRVKQPGLVNSVSGEGNKCEVIYPLLRGTGWQVIALTCDNRGIPADVQTRVEIAEFLVEEALKYEITPASIHVDPLVIAASTDNQAALKFIEATRQIKQRYPEIKVTSGLSNISFGMPLRKTVNRSFLTVAMFAGMDSAIIDPCDREILATLLANEVLLGRDRFCRNFSNAFRQKKIG